MSTSFGQRMQKENTDSLDGFWFKARSLQLTNLSPGIGRVTLFAFCIIRSLKQAHTSISIAVLPSKFGSCQQLDFEYNPSSS
jgi:hypothetical protein